jgi:tetratricopeptide (TPR) repeat protein
MLRAKRLRWLLGAWLVLAGLAGAQAGAAPPPPKESARSYYEKATSAFGLGDYDRAAELYEKAFQLRADSALLYDAAQSHRMAGHKERALQLYRNYVRLYPDSKQTPDARRHIDELQGGGAAVPPAPLGPAVAPSPAPGAGAASPAPGQPPPPVSATPSNLLLAPPPPPSAPGPNAPGGDLTRSASPPEATASDGKKHSSTWIWIALGGAAVVAGAITTAMLLGGSTHDPTPTLGVVGGAGTP